MVELPLAEGQIGVGIPAEPLRLRVTGAIEPRAAERIYLAALSGALAPPAAALITLSSSNGERSRQYHDCTLTCLCCHPVLFCSALLSIFAPTTVVFCL